MGVGVSVGKAVGGSVEVGCDVWVGTGVLVGCGVSVEMGCGVSVGGGCVASTIAGSWTICGEGVAQPIRTRASMAHSRRFMTEYPFC